MTGTGACDRITVNKDCDPEDMSIIEIIIIAVSLAMDAFAVSIGKGLSVGKPSVRAGLICGVWFGGFQMLMPLLGYLLGSTFSSFITSVDHWIAFILLLLIGANMIREGIAGEENNSNKDFSFKTMLILAVATSIDALATGVTFAFLNVNIVLALALIGIITFALSFTGVTAGGLLGRKWQKNAQIAGGIILIAIGLKILIEHLFF